MLDALLGSVNAVSFFRGGAGTGKSFLLRELVEQVRQSGRGIASPDGIAAVGDEIGFDAGHGRRGFGAGFGFLGGN